MKVCITTIAFVAAATLTGCSSPTTASKANFEKAINANFAKSDCTVLPIPMMAWFGVVLGDNGFPVTARIPGQQTGFGASAVNEGDAARIRLFDAMEKAGVFTSKKTKTKFPLYSPVVDGKEYSLTTAGKASQVPGKPQLCIGKPKVTEIVRYTKPGDMDGQTISEVQYTYSLDKVPDWAKNKELQKMLPDLAEMLKPNQSATTTLVLSNDGWGV